MAVLLLNDYWKRNEKGRQKLNEINTNLAKHLQKEKVITYTTTLALTEQDDDLKHAKTKGNPRVSTGQCEEIEMDDVASASFHSASQTRQDSWEAMYAAMPVSATPPTQTSSQRLLRKNYSALVRNMDGQRILKYLVQDDVFSLEKQRTIKEEAGQRTEVLNEKIIDEICREGGRGCAAAVRSLCSALRQDDVKQDYLAELLEPTTHTSARGGVVLRPWCLAGYGQPRPLSAVLTCRRDRNGVTADRVEQ
ncbi:gTPase, IMAP member 8 [Branchiostoma belcheri]|nr:gTPase, IMAP member 8 [Branchiostoma belcheri]